MYITPEENYLTIEDREIRKLVTDYLATFPTEQRLKRINEVLSWRTRYVTVAVEDLYQTQNISAVLRTCECYGVQDVHIVENENEFQIHHAISMGAYKWLNRYHYNDETGGIKGCIQSLKSKGYTVVATLPGEDSCFLQDLPIDTPTAFLFGTELKGLSEEAIQLADKKMKIPMYGFTESFNISNSAAIILSSFIERLRLSEVDFHLTDVEKEELLLEWLQKSIKCPQLIIEEFLKGKGLHI